MASTPTRRQFHWCKPLGAGGLVVVLAVALLAAPVRPAGDARADCSALHWNLVTLLEEATAALFATARAALEVEGVPPERAEAVLRHLREPGPALEESASYAEFQAHFAAFERAQAELLSSAGCAVARPDKRAPGQGR